MGEGLGVWGRGWGVLERLGCGGEVGVVGKGLGVWGEVGGVGEVNRNT